MGKTEEMIAGWVRRARKDAGLSQEALGAKLALELGEYRGFTKANISHWENKKHSPNLKQLMAIAKITGISLPQELLDSMGTMTPVVDKKLPVNDQVGLASLLDMKADTARELRLLTIYRLANEREREAIDDVIDEMSALIEKRSSHETKRAG